ncbi:MAG: substrate-binding domain-containing protein, partial [Chloroflexota bacterium]|nr:substrate-binding domain-containing protein [Chloroflexota bacterium]
AARYRGYVAALAAAGVAAEPDWLFAGGREIEGGRAMAHALLERFPDRSARPTAVVAFNDRTALGALRGFYEAGVRVPGDVAVVGFHDIEAARYATPAVTTVAHPRVELGEMAAEALFARLAGDAIAVRDRVVPTSLRIRESCGAVPNGAYRSVPAAAGARSTTGAGGPDA